MKKTVKTIYNAGIVALFLILGLLIGNFAFAQTVVESVSGFSVVCEGDIQADITVNLIEGALPGTYNLQVIADTPCAGELSFYNSQNTKVYPTSDLADFTTISSIFGFEPLEVSSLDWYCSYGNPAGSCFYLSDSTFDTFSAVIEPDNGFGSFLGSTSPIELVGSVTSGVTETGSSVWPVVGFAGVPVAFTIVGYAVWFIRRSIV